MVYYTFKSLYTDDTNFQLEYDKLIDFRKLNTITKSDCYIEKHHIKPKCFFINESIDIIDNESNIVILTGQEHFMAHYFLLKIHESSNDYYKVKSMYDSMKLTLTHIDNNLLCSKIYENERYNYIKSLSILELDNIKEIYNFYKENSRSPSQYNVCLNESNLSQKLSKLRKKNEENTLHETSIIFIEENNIQDLFLTNKMIELNRLVIINNFIKSNNRIPSQNIKEEKSLNKKFYVLRDKYKNNNISEMCLLYINENDLNNYFELSSVDLFKFFHKKNQIFINKNLNNIKSIHNFVIKNKKNPNKRSKDEEESRLGRSLIRLRSKYKMNILDKICLDYIEENKIESIF